MRGRRTIYAENKALKARLDECHALLAATAISQGGSMLVRSKDLDAVQKDAETCTLKVQLLISGDMRVVFQEPRDERDDELTIQVEGETPCL